MVSLNKAELRPIGLRERKKADTSVKILRSARRLFARNGYSATSMEAIAADADISATTLYNYFGTKGQVLLAMIAQSDDELMRREAAAPKQVANGDPVNFVAGFLGRLSRHSIKSIDRATWHYAIAYTLISETAAEEIKAEYARINGKLFSYLRSILETLKQQGSLPDIADMNLLSEMIFDMYRVLFMRLISNPNLSEEEHEMSLHRYISAAIMAEAVE